MSPSDYRPEIDGLRAVSVIGVLLFHSGWACPGGFVGVDVFFVISGYLITGLIVKDLDDRTFSFTRFWERRVRRILPASLTMTAAVLVAGRSLLLPDELYETAKSMIAHLCFAANIQFWRGSDNYFAVGADYVPMLHTWSLAIEEQFYLVLPVLLFVLHRRSRRLLLPALSLLAAASLTISIVQTAAAPASAFYLLPARGWELLAGGIAALWPRSLLSAGAKAQCLSAVGLVALTTPMFLYDARTSFPGVAALPPCLGCVAVLTAEASSRTFVGRVLSMRWPVAIGKNSYSLYLWHWPLFSFYRILFGKHVSGPAAVGILAASGLLAVLTRRYVETPFRTRRRGASARSLFLQTGAATATLLLSAGWYWRGLGFPERMPPDLLRDASSVGAAFETGRKRLPDDLPRLGSPGRDRVDFVLWGDSHARFLTEALDEAARRSGSAGRAAVMSATPPVPGVWRRREDLELAWGEWVLDFVFRHEVRHVVMAARWNMYVDGYTPRELAELRHVEEHDMRLRAPGGPILTPAEAESLLRTKLVEVADRLRGRGVRLWIVRQPPEFDHGLAAARWLRHRELGTPFLSSTFEAAVEPTIDAARSRSGDRVLDDVASRCADVVVLDTTAALFAGPPEQSKIVRDGRCLYMDDDHVSYFGSQRIVRRLLPDVFKEGSAVEKAPQSTTTGSRGRHLER